MKSAMSGTPLSRSSNGEKSDLSIYKLRFPDLADRIQYILQNDIKSGKIHWFNSLARKSGADKKDLYETLKILTKKGVVASKYTKKAGYRMVRFIFLTRYRYKALVAIIRFKEILTTYRKNSYKIGRLLERKAATILSGSLSRCKGVDVELEVTSGNAKHWHSIGVECKNWVNPVYPRDVSHQLKRYGCFEKIVLIVTFASTALRRFCRHCGIVLHETKRQVLPLSTYRWLPMFKLILERNRWPSLYAPSSRIRSLNRRL